MTTRVLGSDGEDAACAYLTACGWKVLARNYRVREGEIDVVARREGVIAFVEVKTRRTRRFGTPAEAVTWRKQSRIRQIARCWLRDSGLHAPVLRFDVVEVSASPDGFRIRHLEGAF